ncbi:MAG: ImmA/IrrE family metallo-endopeptidase, partial [Lachnospiraceae bacterium]|nr:ImmA/IrrE family metallo-endopeptidase [Lachnospiraceae bacterium]
KVVLDKDGEPVKETVEVTVNAFKPVSTFDISQTEGEPIPNLGEDELMGEIEGYASLIEAIKAVVPVPIEFEDIQSGAKGYFNIEENRIAVKEGMSEVQTVKTMIHEAAHQALHSKEAMEHSADKKTQNQKETEAESIAYVVCQHFGIDTSEYSFPYVATWAADKEVPELKASLDTIRSCSSKLIVNIEEKIKEKELATEKAGYDFEALEDFIKNNGDDIPFDAPVDNPSVTVEPVIDFTEGKKEVELSKAEEKKEEPEKSEKAEMVKDPKKKESIKDKIKKEKVKAEKTKTPKKTPKKNLAQAI